MWLLDWIKQKFQYEEIDGFDTEYVDVVMARAVTYSQYQEQKRKDAILQKLKKIKEVQNEV